jgi:hypothetical protein
MKGSFLTFSVMKDPFITPPWVPPWVPPWI